jgi:hypothetical protein
MKGLILITICFFLLISFSAFNQTNFQNGYIVKTNNEKIEGSLDYQNWRTSPHKIRFLEKGKKESRTYSANEISAFSVSDLRYVSRIIHVDSSSSELKNLSSNSSAENRIDTVFLRVLVQGQSNLFLYKDDGQPHFFMEEDTMKITELLSKNYSVDINRFSNRMQYKGFLKYYWRNYPSLYDQIEALSYTEESLMGVFENYEKMHNQNAYIEKPSNGVSYSPMFVAGMSQTQFYYISGNNTGYPIEINFEPTISPVFGVSLEIAPYQQIATKKISHWSIYNEILYKRYAVEFATNTKFLNQLESADVYKLDFSYLRLSSTFRFQSTGEKLRYFGGLGFSGSFILSTNKNSLNHKRYTFNTTNFTETDSPIIEYVKNFEFGYLGSLGVKYNRYSLELRYESSYGMSGRSDLIKPLIKHIYLIAGYRFGGK